MNAQAKPSEPSMEEILASIRRIIADDEVAPGEAGAPPQPAALAPAPESPAAPEPEPASEALAAPAVVAELEDDVLDLGAEADLVAPSTPAPVTADPAPENLDDIAFSEIGHEPAGAPIPAPQPPPQAFAPAYEPPAASAPAASAPAFNMAELLSDQAGSAVTNAFSQLAHTVLTNNARTLEDLVKDMLKPMLKTWLDDNLPTMVERLVRAEIERVARGGRH